MAPISNECILSIVSQGVEQTQRLGAQLGSLARAGDLFCLEGNLGSGKTCFVQGLARGLGIPETVHSPTFIMANEHRSGRLPLFHIDVYRVCAPGEAIGIGLDDYLDSDGICVIEWAEKIRSVLPPERLWITFRHVAETERGLVIEASGRRYLELLCEFKEIGLGRDNAVGD